MQLSSIFLHTFRIILDNTIVLFQSLNIIYKSQEVCLNMVFLACSFFFPYSLGFLPLLFLFFWGNSISDKFSLFSLSENICFSPSFQNDIFNSYMFLNWHFSSLSSWKIRCQFLLVSMVSNKKSLSFKLFSPLYMSFSTGFFQYFYWSLIFR